MDLSEYICTRPTRHKDQQFQRKRKPYNDGLEYRRPIESNVSFVNITGGSNTTPIYPSYINNYLSNVQLSTVLSAFIGVKEVNYANEVVNRVSNSGS